MERKMVLAESLNGSSRAEHEASLPMTGSSGLAITALFPSGRVEIEGIRYDARSNLGVIDNGSAVQVVAVRDKTLIVEVVE